MSTLAEVLEEHQPQISVDWAEHVAEVIKEWFAPQE